MLVLSSLAHFYSPQDPQPTEWHHPHLERRFLPQLTQSRNPFTACPYVCLQVNFRPCQLFSGISSDPDNISCPAGLKNW